MKIFEITCFSALFALGACATAAVGDREASDKAADKLAEFDRTGEVERCVNLRRIDRVTALDDSHFLFEVGLNEYYLNKVSGRCANASRAGYRIQYSTSLSQLCRNEIITVVDNSSGFTAGSCGLGDFERLEKKPTE